MVPAPAAGTSGNSRPRQPGGVSVVAWAHVVTCARVVARSSRRPSSRPVSTVGGCARSAASASTRAGWPPAGTRTWSPPNWRGVAPRPPGGCSGSGGRRSPVATSPSTASTRAGPVRARSAVPANRTGGWTASPSRSASRRRPARGCGSRRGRHGPAARSTRTGSPPRSRSTSGTRAASTPRRSARRSAKPIPWRGGTKRRWWSRVGSRRSQRSATGRTGSRPVCSTTRRSPSPRRRRAVGDRVGRGRRLRALPRRGAVPALSTRAGLAGRAPEGGARLVAPAFGSHDRGAVARAGVALLAVDGEAVAVVTRWGVPMLARNIVCAVPYSARSVGSSMSPSGANGWTRCAQQISLLNTLPMPARHTLVEERVADRRRGIKPREPCRDRVEVDLAGAQVGAEGRRASRCARDRSASRPARRTSTIGAAKHTALVPSSISDDDPRRVRGPVPPLAASVHVPPAVQLHVRVQHRAVGERARGGVCRAPRRR